MDKKKRRKGPKVSFGFPPPISPVPSPQARHTLDVPETIKLNGTTYNCTASDFKTICPLGKGNFGVVRKMLHEPTGKELAVKSIPYTFNSPDEQQKMRDLDISMRLSDCQFAICIYGALYQEGDVWIFMELMTTSLDKLYGAVKDHGEQFPEPVLQRIAFSVVSALEYLHQELRVIHRDVKPSNILVNDSGDIKLCDFGVSGVLVDSLAKTNVGCKPYMAPERIDPARSQGVGYDIRSDVWSLGITMVELTILAFPYDAFKDMFAQINAVVMGPPPTIPKDRGYSLLRTISSTSV